jgi:glycosyltransferase involved in cell wall biosynthesis
MVQQKSHDFHFFSFYEWNYSRSGTFLTGLIEGNPKFNFHKLRTGTTRTLRDLKNSLEAINRGSQIVILSGSNILAVYMKLLGQKDIVLDAGWSSFEATKKRDYGVTKPYVLAKLYFLELISFWSAARILVESASQRRYLSRIFFIPKRKIFVLPTGVNEQAFKTRKKPLPMDLLSEVAKDKFVFFRGKNVAESGLNVIARSTWLVRRAMRFVIVTDQTKGLKFNPLNTTVLEGFQEYETLKFLYENATAVLGQISETKRLRNTIPHKTFEAALFSKPYVTLFESAVLELFSKESVIGLEKASPDALANLVDWVAVNTEESQRRGLEFGQQYIEKYQQQKLQKQFLDLIAV